MLVCIQEVTGVATEASLECSVGTLSKSIERLRLGDVEEGCGQLSKVCDIGHVSGIDMLSSIFEVMSIVKQSH